MKICMYEGYLRNQHQLLRELDIEARKDRRQTELAILKAAYHRWRYDIGNHLHGSFALVIHDEASQEFFAVRDPFGLEPLYYCLTENGSFLYGHSIQSVADRSDFKKKLDPEALFRFMVFGYPVGEQTLYLGIKKLLPGRYLQYNKGICKISSYYSCQFHPDDRVSEEDWAEMIDYSLLAVLDEDRSCFNFSKGASFLSGGIDSSYLLASSGIGKAYGIGYGEDSISEAFLARSTALRLGADFNEIRITSEDFFHTIPVVMQQLGLPTADASTIAFFIGCREAAADSLFCLSGEGADEFFAGYHIYRRAKELGNNGEPCYYGCSGIMSEETAGQLLLMNGTGSLMQLLKDIPGLDDISEPLSRMLMTDIALWFEGDILFGAGGCARANGLSVLMPFADRRIFELSSAIPSYLKRKGGCEKYILRKAASNRLPWETAFRRKVGFSVPVKIWFREEKHRDMIESILFGSTSANYFNQELLKKIWNHFLMGKDVIWNIIYTKDVIWNIIYTVYVFIIWHDISGIS